MQFILQNTYEHWRDLGKVNTAAEYQGRMPVFANLQTASLRCHFSINNQFFVHMYLHVSLKYFLTSAFFKTRCKQREINYIALALQMQIIT